MLAALKLVLLLSFLLLAHRHVPEVVNPEAWHGGTLNFFGIWALSITSLFLAAFHRSLIWRALFTVLTVTAAGNALAYLNITGSVLNAIEVERLFQDIAFIDETFSFYGELVFRGIGIAALLAVGVLLPAKKMMDGRVTLWTGIGALLLASVGVGHTVYNDGGGDSDGFPAYIAPLGFAGVLLFDQATRLADHERAVVTATPEPSPFQKVVVLMDESVRGDWLDLNVAGGVPTGLPEQSARMVNFGLAASFANCSAASNLSMRYFVRRDSYRADAREQASMWAFAKRAGYKTIYLDGQRRDHELQNFMTAAELAEVDEFIQLPKLEHADKDMRVVEILRALLARDEKLFIYVNKNGVHFPYEGKYPETLAPYQPRMASTQVANEGNQYGDGFGNEAFRNSYRNAVAWNTGEFFRRLLKDQSLQNTLMIYSSDHGQNFTKTQESGFLTHCTVGPAPAPEGTVPLVALTENPDWLQRLRVAADARKNKTSHWNVPGTLLQAMGYAPNNLAGRAEPSLFESDPRAAEFISTYFVRFGLQPVWNKPVQEAKKD